MINYIEKRVYGPSTAMNLYQDQMDDLAVICEENGVTRIFIIRQLIDKFLKEEKKNAGKNQKGKKL